MSIKPHNAPVTGTAPESQRVGLPLHQTSMPTNHAASTAVPAVQSMKGAKE